MSVLVLASLTAFLAAEPRSPAATPEARALAYLAREVPRWATENKCYSCHNNGDAARALFTARRLTYPLPAKALNDTTRWLSRPAGWDHNGGDPRFSNKVLARIQFAAALAEAIDAGVIKDGKALAQAAELVAEHQQKDGSWQIGTDGSIGSPTTHGPCLATYFARQVLHKADPKRYQDAITRADRWLRNTKVQNVLDAAAVLLALADAGDAEAVARRRECLALLRKGEAAKGGWGPYVQSPPEPFDTAVVLLALARRGREDGVTGMIRRGRAYLLSAQQDDGSWPETTRPADGESYAQRVSTTGWATLALLATSREAPRGKGRTSPTR